MKGILVATALLVGGVFYAQDYKEKNWTQKEKSELEKDYQIYKDAVFNNDWELVADMLYPGIYQLDTRENIVRAMKNGMQSPEVKIEIGPSADTYIFPHYLVKNKRKYALISYTHNFSMIFNRKPGENDMTFQGRMDYTYHKLKNKYGNQIIKGSEPGIFHFHIPKHLLAIYIPEKKQYTFLDFSTQKNSEAMLYRILDKEIIDYFKRKINSN